MRTAEVLWVLGFGLGFMWDDAGDLSIWLGPIMIVISEEE